MGDIPDVLTAVHNSKYARNGEAERHRLLAIYTLDVRLHRVGNI
jgi:hypothetical protein